MTFALLTILVIAVVSLVVTASTHRKHARQTDPRLCRGCGSSHPPFAHFCSRCGRALDGDSPQAARRT